jgi:hypothetical protein
MMVDAMRWSGLLVFSAVVAAAEIGGSNVHTVYVMPMANGLDQYIAHRLTQEHVLEVIADPQRADALFTDRLGEPLEYELEKLHPRPKAEAPADKAEKDNEAEGQGAAVATTNQAAAGSRTMTDSGPPRVSTFGRGKGTLFLVDARSRAVLWSVYEKPKRSSPDQLDSTARRVVDRLKRTLAGK